MDEWMEVDKGRLRRTAAVSEKCLLTVVLIELMEKLDVCFFPSSSCLLPHVCFVSRLGL